MRQLLARTWPAAEFAVERDHPFSIDLDLRDRRPVLTLRGRFSAAHAVDALAGILHRLDQIAAPARIDTAGVTEFGDPAMAVVLEAARRRVAAGAPPLVLDPGLFGDIVAAAN